MSKYINDAWKEEIRKTQIIVYDLRKIIMTGCGVDITDTDTLSSLSVYDTVITYDVDYDINFSRNGEDGRSGSLLDMETKVTKVDGYRQADGQFVQCKYKPDSGSFVVPRNVANAITKRDAKFQFHVMGDISHDAYIFAVAIKDSLDLLRLYDIRTPANVQIVNQLLLSLKSEYLKKFNGHVAKRDVVVVAEEFILNNIVGFTKTIINGCEVFRA